MRISVLIATCNRTELLRECLASLARNTRAPDEIVVADQSDDDATATMIRQFDLEGTPVIYLRIDSRGKSRSLNEAIRASGGDLLALTDDDVQVDEHWLATLDELHRAHPDVVAFCGRVLPEPGSDPSSYYNLVMDTERRWITGKTNPLTPAFCGANIAVRRSAMLEAGAYNVHFGPGALFRNNDDGDLAYRLTRLGERLLFAPELIVYHSAWRGEVDKDALKFEYTYSLGAFAGYYLRRRHLRPVLYLAKKGLFKMRQFVAGMLTGNSSNRRDARIQLRGLCRGFLGGVRVTDPGTLPPEPRARSGGVR